MNDAEFTMIVSQATREIQDRTPYDTGNLATNATRSESLGPNQIRISVDTRIAPYFKYVNFFKDINGRPNRNYRYWDNAIRAAAESMARSCNGRVEIV